MVAGRIQSRISGAIGRDPEIPDSEVANHSWRCGWETTTEKLQASLVEKNGEAYKNYQPSAQAVEQLAKTQSSLEPRSGAL